MQIQMKGITKAVRATMLGTAVAATALSAQAVEFIGLTNVGSLVRFDSANPGMVSSPLAVMGLGVDERLLTIDVRPTTGVLYGVSNDSKVYTIDTTTGQASLKGSLYADITPDNNRPPAVGLDFNPATDLSGARNFRVTTSDGLNLAAFSDNPSSATVTTNLQFTNVLSVAYANNDVDPATGTSLYYIQNDPVGSGSAKLYINNGGFNGGLMTLIGDLGVDVTGVGGFDIVGANTAFASLVVDDGLGLDALYSIDLASGKATSLGMIGADASLVGLAVAPVPEPETYALMLGGLGMLAFLGRRRQQRGSRAA